MRHQKSGRKFNRTSAHRGAMFSNMAASLFKNELIRTRQDKELERRGEGAEGWDPSSYLVFSGKQLESIRTDDVFRDAQERIYVPTVEEQARFMLTHNAPQTA